MASSATMAVSRDPGFRAVKHFGFFLIVQRKTQGGAPVTAEHVVRERRFRAFPQNTGWIHVTETEYM